MRIGKKGFLLGEYTLKIIIAVISLALLFYLLFMIYSSSQENKQLVMAEASLNDLVDGMNRAKENPDEDVEVIILNPVKESFIGKGWHVISWPYGGGEERPQGCIDNCICICSMPKFSTQGGSLKQCDSLGVCENFDEKIKTIGGLGVNLPIVIKDPPVDVQVKYSTEGFEIRAK